AVVLEVWWSMAAAVNDDDGGTQRQWRWRMFGGGVSWKWWVVVMLWCRWWRGGEGSRQWSDVVAVVAAR
nr:hypothetical protein [Tanacetum cinerariifolium]